MIENLSIIAPIFTIMFIGFFMGKTEVFPEGSGSARALTTFVWYVAIPALLFKLLGNNAFPSLGELQVVLGYYLALYVLYFISAFLIAPRLKIEKKGYGVFAFSSSFGNLGFIGISVIQSAFGEEGLRILLILITFHMITLLPITTFISEIAKQDSGSPTLVLRRAIIHCLKNPVVISLFISLSWAATGIGISPLAMRILDFPASTAAPVGLFAVGLSLSRVKLRGDLIHAVVPVVLKLAFLPFGVFIMVTYVMDIPELWAKTAILAACMPTGMASYSIAEQYGTGTKAVASTVMLGTIVSTITLMIAVSLLI